MSFSFGELNLSGVKVNTGGYLKPGKHLVRVNGATVVKTQKGGAQAEVVFEALNGDGSIKCWYNLFTPSSKQNTDTGLGYFKTLLVMGGHPTPDHPGDIKSLIGLVVGIQVREKKKIPGQDENRTFCEVHFAFDPHDLDPVNYVKKIIPSSDLRSAASPSLKIAVGGEIIPF